MPHPTPHRTSHPTPSRTSSPMASLVTSPLSSASRQLASTALSRRGFLRIAGLGSTAALAGGALMACGNSSSSEATAASDGLTNLPIQLSWVADSEWSPLFLADSNGYYADNGVSVDLVPGGADIGAIEGIVAAGQAKIGIATDITTVIAAAADGNPLKCVGALYQSNLNVLMSAPEAPITTVADLSGKRVGGPQGVQTKIDAMFTLAGLEADYTYIPTGYGPDALINGDCDALSVFITDEVLAYEDATGQQPAILTFTDAGLPAYTLAIFTTDEVLANERDAVKGFLAATRQGFADDVADPTAGPTLAVDEYGRSAGLDLESEIAKNREYIRLASSPGTEEHGYLWLDKEFIAGPVYRGMEASGMKTTPVDNVIDTSLLEEIGNSQ